MIIYKILFGTKVIYDVQENYKYNLLYANILNNKTIKYVIATITRTVEWICTPFVNLFILAEACYEQELPFLGKKYIILDNKINSSLYPEYQIKKKTKITGLDHIHFCYTGTIATSYGVLNAIKFFAKFQIKHPDSTLVIIGYCINNKLFKKIKESISLIKNCKLIGGDHLVSHVEILKVIWQSDVMLTPYIPNNSTKNKIPTKFYEAMYLKTKILCQNNSTWEDFLKRNNLGICIDFENFNEEIIMKLKETETKEHNYKDDFDWKINEQILLDNIHKLL